LNFLVHCGAGSEGHVIIAVSVQMDATVKMQTPLFVFQDQIQLICIAFYDMRLFKLFYQQMNQELLLPFYI
jgi:hypothetical protein